MGAEACETCLLGAMDRLWFHQIIIFSEDSTFLFPETCRTALPTSESPNFSLEKSFRISSAASVTTCSKVESSGDESDDDRVKEATKHKKIRPIIRFNHVSRKTRYHSSSPVSAKEQSRNVDYSAKRLQKTMSLGDLELEEVKGFMDLGFIFKKENLSRRMIRLIPGLKRIDTTYKTKEQDSQIDQLDELDAEDKKGTIMRPYLSEAWLIKRPDSPLLNVRIPRDCSASDMKKNLKSWARTVALTILQES